MPYKDPEKRRAYLAAYRQSHPEQVKGYYRKYNDKWRKEGRPKHQQRKTAERRNWLKSKYGLSQEDYIRLSEKQHGVCAICFQPETRIVKGKHHILAVDHCHTTGKVRALLCSRCNMALGLLKEDTARIHSMIRYIEEHNGEVDPKTT